MEDKHKWKKENERKIHPKISANFLKQLFFSWQLPLFVKGWKKDLDEDDLYAPLPEYTTEILGDKLEELWLLEKHCKKNPSLKRALIKQFSGEFCLYAAMYLPTSISLLLLKPFFLNKILDYFSPNSSVSLKSAYIYSSALIALMFIYVVIFNFILMQMAALGMKIRIATSSLIYRHVLKLKQAEIQEITSGKIVNLLSNDVSRFDESLVFSHAIWATPIHVVLGACYLDLTVDYTALAGIGVLALFLLLTVCISKKISTKRNAVAERTDHRIGLLTDVISGIQVIKMYTWEEPFMRLIQKARSSELTEIKKANLLRFAQNSVINCLLPLTLVANIAAFMLTGFHTTAQYFYSLMSIYQDLLYTATVVLPFATVILSEAITSIERIQKFLLTDNRELSQNDRYIPKAVNSTLGIALENVSLKLGNPPQTVLAEVNFNASPGDLVGVVGTAGSGKSVLLQALLKEIEVAAGSLNLQGRIAYASQTPWIFPASVRQNILFGEDFDLGKYQRVIQVCALDKDLSLLPHADQTLVGERGLMLSGGQKARINLARAVYRDANVYLLDDPLSALDSQVAKHVFDECILKFLDGKCVVLVTHQVHHLQRATKIYHVKDSTVKLETSFGQVKEHFSGNNREETSFVDGGHLPSKIKEHRSTRQKKANIYRQYCSAAGHWSFSVSVVTLMILAQGFRSFSDCLLMFWSEDDTFFSGNTLLLIYVGAVGCLFFTNCLSFTTLAAYCCRSSKNLHKKLFSNIIKGKMSFFNQHPSGRILNRFSKDMGAVDEILPVFVYLLTAGIGMLVGMIVVVTIINYWMIIPSIILCTSVYLSSIIFKRTNTSLKRTESTTRSHLFTHLTATLQGLPTIRATGAEKVLAMEFDKHQDFHTSAFYLVTSVYCAFGFWIAMSYVFYVGILVFSFLFWFNHTHVGSVGLAISLSTNLTELFQYIVKDWSDVDTHMTSVERIQEYIDIEPEVDTGTAAPPQHWPSFGNIIFDRVSLRYFSDKEAVLKQVSFHASSGENIGIVGRTGAGKTSLISVLFRLYDFDGKVTIDGFDTKLLPLRLLRSKISIIPQDPVLFVGTLRKNLDPFGQFTDEQIWNTLNELELKNMFPQLVEGLESDILEGGSNFSVGQRQLLCLARTMLRKSKIIVLDEATANVDHGTDKLIQSVIRKKFWDCTVLIVAHRLNTVIDCDKILVMENGHAMEFDHPYKLLRNRESLLYGYIKGSGGEKVMKNLMKIAADCYFKANKT